MRRLIPALLAAVVYTTPGLSSTLEKLSLDEMAQKSTRIVRGKVGGCSGEARGAIIYTRCSFQVSETWKGQSSPTVDFFLPGGTAQGLKQVFSGCPSMKPGEEYVLFLWAGRSGMHQVIGLSQGVFDLKPDGKGVPLVRRAASTEVMLDKSGNRIEDAAVEMTVTSLKAAVRQALEGAQ